MTSTSSNKIEIRAENYEDLRDNISTTGLFDILDCAIEIECPLDASTSELQKITTLLESVINVTDILILSGVYSDDNQYVITAREVSVSQVEGRVNTKKKNN
jgi:hypothetical protein